MKISDEKLQEIIASHGKWLRNREGGQRADLREAYLYGVDLREADLRGADLSGAVLRGADLSGADLRDADLSYAYIGGADLSGADLGGADLSCAYLDKTYYQVVRIGSRKGTTTYCVDDDNVLCGCWNYCKGGTLTEFKQRVEDVYGENGKTPNAQYYTEYMAAVAFFETVKGLKGTQKRR